MLQTLNNLSLCRRAKELIDVKTSRTGNEGGLRRPQDQPDLLSNCEVWKLPTIYGRHPRSCNLGVKLKAGTRVPAQEQESLQVLLQVVLQFAPVILSGSTAKQVIYGDTIGLATLVLQQEDKYKSAS